MKAIPVSRHKVTYLDDDDFERFSKWTWTLSRDGYAVHYQKKNRHVKCTSLSRLIMNAPDGMEVDHINGDTLDNQKANLRICTRQQNCWNMGPRRNNKFKGVTTINLHPFHGDCKKIYRAAIVISGKKMRLGTFSSEEDAALAYDIAALKYHRSFARLNFPNFPAREEATA